MYRKKEIIGIILILTIVIAWNIVSRLSKSEKENIEEISTLKDHIVLKIEGEIARPIELQYVKPISYGILFLRIENSLNEYSDLSSFNFDEMITISKSIVIPTYDSNNMYSPNERISIHLATLEDLKKLPQIGEKRGQKILDYIVENGKIESWEEFFKIASVPENAKAEIKKQAVL